MENEIIQVSKLSFLSRFILYIISILSTMLIHDYDTSNTIQANLSFYPDFDLGSSEFTSRTRLDEIFQTLFRQFSHWDGVYFLRIAEAGYDYEHFHAFFPFFPICISFFAKLIHPFFFNMIQFKTALLISGFFLSNLFFVLSAIQFYR